MYSLVSMNKMVNTEEDCEEYSWNLTEKDNYSLYNFKR